MMEFADAKSVKAMMVPRET